MEAKPGPSGLNVYEVYLQGAPRPSTTTYASTPEGARLKVLDALPGGSEDVSVTRVTQHYQEFDRRGRKREEERDVE